MKITPVYPSRLQAKVAGIVLRGVLVLSVLAAVYAAELVIYSFTKTFWGVKIAAAAETVSNWWPVEGKVMTGVQPFKAIVPGRNIESYQMFWRVDGGALVAMYDSYEGYPHKEAMVDLSGWQWKGTGPYRITFVAEANGATIGKEEMSIYTGTPTVQPAPASVIAPVTEPAPVSSLQIVIPTAGNPLQNAKFYVDPNGNARKEAEHLRAQADLLEKIASNSQARWFGGWNQNIEADVSGYVGAASAQNAVPVLVAYNIPNRDCGNYSAGGAGSPDAYRSWINGFANGIAGRKAVVVLEPDAVALTSCLSEGDKQTRNALLKEAVTALKSKGAAVYLDAGHSGWASEADLAARLKNAGLASADGFSLNVSNFETTSANAAYGAKISSLTGGTHFVIDTSRNGRGGNGEWCNPWGRGLGERPTTNTGNSLIDAYLWVKAPGESDGSCNGGPSAGTWWLDYALMLARNAAF
ncbi:MAG: glycoside hydrolase family 6 protein [bacterium]|nr:glycoside hydrolase family 6 protein [bacterium]